MPSHSIALHRVPPLCFKPVRCLTTHQLFDRSPLRAPSRLNALLSSHIHGSPLDAFAFSSALAACSSLSGDLAGVLACQIHALMIRTGFHSSTIPATALIGLYSKLCFPIDALNVFDEIPNKDVVSWNSLISCFTRRGLAGDAISLFRSMMDDGVKFTGFTLCSLLKACSFAGALRQGKQVHSWVLVSGCDSKSIVMNTAIIDFYSSCKLVEDAITVFRNLDGPKDAAVYNALLNGCFQNGLYEVAFSILGQIDPNEITLTCALSGCSKSLNLLFGKQIHCTMIRREFLLDTILCNALVDMYTKCGEINAARLVFDRIDAKDVVSWTSMIDAYGSHGHGVEALNLFKRMEKEESHGVLPNDATFLSVLSACGHSGLVDEGRNCFFLMRGKHGLHPGPEHYACVIDMLGRAHMIEEAWALFCEVCANGEKLVSAVCMAMLNACKLSMDFARGDCVAKHLMKLDPDNPSSYVLISNFYSDFGRWDIAEDMRRVICTRGLRKKVCSSQIAVGA